VPTETAGPYPGDGSNGPDVLDDSGIVRHDIRRSFGSSRTLAKGVPLRVNLTVTDAAKDDAPMPGAAVYLWHCDRSGRYSMYSSEIEDENYLRGIAATDSDGTAWFRTIFPACYSGRWPHIHFLLGQCEQPRADLAVARHGLRRRHGSPPARDGDGEREPGVRGEPHRGRLTSSPAVSP
jgi:protocatechuate 3,4-dioxygenase beta subunit